MPRGMSPEDLGLEEGTIINIERDGRGYKATTIDGDDVTDKVATHSMRNAFKSNAALQLFRTKNNNTQWRQVSQHDFDVAREVANRQGSSEEDATVNIHKNEVNAEGMTDAAIKQMVNKAMDIKPPKIQISELWWKFAVRSALRGDNLLVVGPSGCGKTLLASSLAQALDRQDRFFYVNLGSTQDPRSTLIGNTHFNQEKGTYVALSYFIRAIQTPNAVVLLDEASRAHPEAHNILMTILDKKQRYVRVDERDDSATIDVAQGVTFVLTANIGAEYTATRTMDRALLDRCVYLQMDPLDKAAETRNLRATFPDLDKSIVNVIASVASDTREEVHRDDPKLDTIISSRMTEQWASLVQDGFTVEEAAEVAVYPFFSDAGGADAPRGYIKKLLQKALPSKSKTKKKDTTADDGVTVPPWLADDD